MKKPSYFAIIPAKVRYDSKLTNSQKIMFGEITALANKRGYCNASNTYFSKLYSVDPSTISKWVKGLQGQGYIELEYTREGKQIKGRKLRPLMDYKGIEINQQGVENIQEGVLNKSQGGIEYISKYNNTSNNNTRERAREESGKNLHPLQKFVKDELSEVSKLEKQLTKDNCKKLISDFGREQVHDVLLAMENYNGLEKKYKSVYLTTRNWCKKRNEGKPETTTQPKQLIV